MGKYKEVDGDLIELAREGFFDIICHGCNCQTIMAGGIAPLMDKAFGALEIDKDYERYLKDMTLGDFHRSEKLGNIVAWVPFLDTVTDDCPEGLIVINAYTQYDITARKTGGIDLDYEALRLCLRKINYAYKGKHIGLPQIGCGLGGGSWRIVKEMIIQELKDCEVTIVIFKK